MNFYAKTLITPSLVRFIPHRTGYVVKHAFPIPPTPPGQEQRPPTDKQLFQQYKIEKLTESSKMPMAKIILTKNVEGIGKAGEIVSVRSFMVREFYIPSGSAVYASPYNVEKYSKLRDIHEEPTIEPHIKLGISKSLYDLTLYLNSKAVPVYLALENKWAMEKWHVTTALRLHDVFAKEDQVILNPNVQFKGPDMKLQNQLFRFYVVANKKVVIPCYGRIQHVTTKTFKQMLTPTLADPTSLTEQESRKWNLIEEDVFLPAKHDDTLSLSNMNDEQIWKLMQERMEAKKKEMETNPVLISRRQQAAMDAEQKKRRDKEINELRCLSFDLPRTLDPWDERELALAKQKAKRNRYWDDDAHNWREPLGRP